MLLINQEQNRLGQAYDNSVIRMIQKVLKTLKKQQKDVDQLIEAFLKEEAKINEAVDVILSVPGVGVVTTSTLIADPLNSGN